jgi:hypothetical protein
MMIFITLPDQNVLRDESYRTLRALLEKLDVFRIMKISFSNLRAPSESLKKNRIIRSISPPKKAVRWRSCHEGSPSDPQDRHAFAMLQRSLMIEGYQKRIDHEGGISSFYNAPAYNFD